MAVLKSVISAAVGPFVALIVLIDKVTETDSTACYQPEVEEGLKSFIQRYDPDTVSVWKPDWVQNAEFRLCRSHFRLTVDLSG